MKKIIIILLMLIPLLIIFTITASGRIISAEVEIGIESFELWHKGEPVTEATINYGEYTRKKLKYQLIPRYYPGVAKVSGFKWYSDNENVAKVDEEGIVTFLECGFAKITAESLDSASVRASCAFFVEDDTIHDILFYSYETGDRLTSYTAAVYESRQVRVEITPYSALVGDPVYASSNESVFTCSPSGVITAVGEGSAELSVTAKSKDGKSKKIVLPVTVSGTALVKQKVVYAYGDGDFDLTPYLSSGNVEGGSVVDLSEIAYDQGRVYTVSLGARTETIVVKRLSHEKTIGIKGLDQMLVGEWKSGVYAAVGRTLTLTPVDLATSSALSGVTVTSSDPSIASVSGGVVTTKGVGRVTLTFSRYGYQECAIELTVATPVSYFALNLDADNDLVGLGSERVYGTKSVYNGEITDGIRVTPENIYPSTADRSLFSYAVEGDIATVDKEGVVTFKESAIGKTVTVTVKSLFSTNAMSRTYTFRNIVKGINVGFGFGANAFEKGKTEPSFTPYSDALKTMTAPRDLALVFQTNIYMPTREDVGKIEGEYQKLSLNRDYYGNGYKIDGQFYQYDYESHIFRDADDKSVEADQTGVTIVDLYINSYAPVGGESEETFDALMEKGGEPIRSFFKERPDFRITFRYCVFQYSYSHACLIGGTFVFDGCVFRNSAGSALLIQSLHEQENDVTINNCIFSNSISITAIVSNGTFPLPEGEEVHYNSLSWTGKNYIYNWKKKDEIRLDIIPKGLMKNENLDVILESVNDKLSECARNSFRGDENKDLIVHYEKEDYVNMGVFFVNYWAPDKTILNGTREKVTDGMPVNVDLENASFIKFEINTIALGSVRKITKKMLDLDSPTYMLTNRTSNGEFTTAPGETYKLDASTFARLRGQSR